MNIKDIQNKIRNLQAVANDPSATEGEKANAMSLMMKLVNKHNIELATIKIKETNSFFSKNDIFNKTSISYSKYKWGLVQGLAKLFNCRAMKWNNKFKFYGLYDNVNFACDLTENINALMNKQAREVGKSKRRVGGIYKYNSAMINEFCHEASEVIRQRCSRITNNFRIENSNSTELVVYDNIEKVIDEIFQDFGNVKMKDTAIKIKKSKLHEARFAGQIFGKSVKLNNQLGGEL